ncbi:hypothetical protein O0L34_g16754 [Tuta absoluta]|nr:hypothetical protein O0L34_g16754 [Tuta absoluta]
MGNTVTESSPPNHTSTPTLKPPQHNKSQSQDTYAEVARLRPSIHGQPAAHGKLAARVKTADLVKPTAQVQHAARAQPVVQAQAAALAQPAAQAQPGCLSAAPPRTSALHLFNFSVETTTADIIDHLKLRLKLNVARCEKLTTLGEYSSFKLDVPAARVRDIRNRNLWPEGVAIRPFNEITSKPGRQTDSKNTRRPTPIR